MARYKGNEPQDIMVPVCLDAQLLPGTIEHAIDWIIDHDIDTSRFDALYRNDEGGPPAYDPKALLKVVLFGYSKGILSSRGIERACRTNIVFMALCGDVHPDHATIARFVTAHGTSGSPNAAEHAVPLTGGSLIKTSSTMPIPTPTAARPTRGSPATPERPSEAAAEQAIALTSRTAPRASSPPGACARTPIAEPVFGNITANKKMNRFMLRGRSKIRIQWLLFALVHNIEKIATTGLIHSLAAP